MKISNCEGLAREVVPTGERSVKIYEIAFFFRVPVRRSVNFISIDLYV